MNMFNKSSPMFFEQKTTPHDSFEEDNDPPITQTERAQDLFEIVLHAARIRNGWTKFPDDPVPNKHLVLSWYAPIQLGFSIRSGYEMERNPETPLVYVNDIKSANAMIEHLKSQNVISFLLKTQTSRTYYGLVSLILLSTQKYDFIYDPFPLHDHACSNLKKVFENPSIVKLCFNPENELQYLMINFQIFPVGLICLQKIDSVLYPQENINQPVSLAGLRDKYLDISKTDDIPIFTDWSIRDQKTRHLPEELESAVRYDAHDLVRIFENQLTELLHLSKSHSESDPLVYLNLAITLLIPSVTKVPVLKIYPPVQEILSKAPMSTLPKAKADLFTVLYNWRDKYARFYDEQPDNILSLAHLYVLSQNCPTNVTTMVTSLRTLPPYIRRMGAMTLLTVLRQNIKT